MISDKQRQIMMFPYTGYDALICDGAVRAGKTVFMTLSFVDYAMNTFNNQRFGIAGKTVGSAVKNIIEPFLSLYIVQKKYNVHWTRSYNTMTIQWGKRTNVFEVFGGKDESSYMLVQGRTLAGIMLDEVALMPESFVNQALARCSVSKSKIFFNCNPSSPNHWFYQDWILHAEERNALRLHFELRDNPSLTDEIIERYENMYHGVFYDRYIKGLWKLAEGLIYDNSQECMEDTYDGDYNEAVISIDYGTQNPFAALKWLLAPDGVWHCVDEYVYSGRVETKQKTDGEYADDLEEFTEGLDYPTVIVDPSAASFIAELRKRELYSVRKGKNAVLKGIRDTSTAIKLGRIKISKDCKNVWREFGLYVWDERCNEDRPVKENDHCLTGDTMVETVSGQKRIKDLCGKVGLVKSYDEQRGKMTLRPFFGVRKTQENAEILKITLEDGRAIRCTGNHRILTENGWIRAEHLTEYDSIIEV